MPLSIKAWLFHWWFQCSANVAIHTQERIEMINRYIRLFGKGTIDCLLADREFVGCQWIKFLNDNHIRYNNRIRENFYVERRGKKVKASWLFASLQCGQTTFLHPIYYLNGQLCYLSVGQTYEIFHKKHNVLKIKDYLFCLFL